MKRPLISIIVPVYRVEKYICKCVESLLEQTYENIEIILIDDGSPDRCGEFCDEFARKDSRVIVLHQRNAGLASARNAGLAIAKGTYIGFCDSDDFVDKDMYEFLLKTLTENNCVIAACSFKKFSEKGEIIGEQEEAETIILNNRQAMKELLNDELIGSQPCNKLFHRNLWDGILFPKGRVYEDIAIMHEVFANADKVVVKSAGKYHYFIREDSTSYTQNAKWGYDLFSAFRDRYKFVEKNYSEFLTKAYERLIGIAVGMYIHLQHFKRTPKIRTWEKEIRECLEQQKKRILKCKSVSTQRKCDAFLILYFPVIISVKHRILYKLRRPIR